MKIVVEESELTIKTSKFSNFENISLLSNLDKYTILTNF